MVNRKHNAGERRGMRPWSQKRDTAFGHLQRERNGLHRELDRLFEDFWHNQDLTESFGLSGPVDMSPRIDETEDESAYHIEVELPGMDQKDVEVIYSDGLLTVSGEKKQESEEKEKNYYRRERSFGSFQRVLQIPGLVKESDIKASFKKGVLQIDLPKSEEAKKATKKIAVKAG